MNNWGMVSRGGMNNWGMVSRGGVNNWGMVSWGGVNNWSMVSRGGVNNWGMVSRGSMNNRSSSSSITSNSFICDIRDVSRVSISSVVDHLSPTIRKSNLVTTRRGVTISLFLLSKVSSAVVIIHSILISIHWRFIIHWLCSSIGNSRGSRAYSNGSGEEENLHVCSTSFNELIPC